MTHEIDHCDTLDNAILRRMIFTKEFGSLEKLLRGTLIIAFWIVEVDEARVSIDFVLSAGWQIFVSGFYCWRLFVVRDWG